MYPSPLGLDTPTIHGCMWGTDGGVIHAPADPDPKLDVDEANRELMEQGEEMYEALMNCHWQPLDYTAPEMFAVVSP